ncbi:hypothetical protein EST38_g5480 [Candolleomyces aberdarensis]|uniref:Uncharacterized protein n=1 Tax=Candolleomyces aberdarensis TaxID=2316362 RepID=A0A4V1Q402_9AGAR|nr:hypothetical protein EST38_g5480 [Candolleomyces aberdarensis]
MDDSGTSDGRFIGGRMDGEIGNCWLYSPDTVELSVGTLPHFVINISESSDATKEGCDIALWHPAPHPTFSSGSMLVSKDPLWLYHYESYHYCKLLDIEHNAKGVTRGIQISLRPLAVMDMPGDGYARLYDVRQPLSGLTFAAGDNADNCSAVVLCHPDGIPLIFTRNSEEEAIRLWDICSKAPLHDLSTGNNQVTEMVWSEEQKELHAATESPYMDRYGRFMGYRNARIPQEEGDGEEEGLFEIPDDDYSDRAWGKRRSTSRRTLAISSTPGLIGCSVTLSK